jgi:hypothetical protein
MILEYLEENDFLNKRLFSKPLKPLQKCFIDATS